jgi:small GTP-binding protein
MQPTVGIDFHIKNVTRNGRQYRIQLWDTAGQERFRSLIPNYMKDANCAVMVYDVSKKPSLDNLKVWNEMFEEHQTPDAVKVLVGNKIDLTDRQVSKKEGEAEAVKYQSKHFEVSAKLGKKLDELFNSIIDLIIDHLENRGNLPAIEEKEERKDNKDKEGKPKGQ